MLPHLLLAFLAVLLSLAPLSVTQNSAYFTSSGPLLIPGDYNISLSFRYGDAQAFAWDLNGVEANNVDLVMWQEGNVSDNKNAGSPVTIDSKYG